MGRTTGKTPRDFSGLAVRRRGAEHNFLRERLCFACLLRSAVLLRFLLLPLLHAFKLAQRAHHVRGDPPEDGIALTASDVVGDGVSFHVHI